MESQIRTPFEASYNIDDVEFTTGNIESLYAGIAKKMQVDDSTGGRSKDNSNPLLSVWNKINKEPNDFEAWDELFDCIDLICSETLGSKTEAISDDLKKFINKSYTRLCFKFPYLTEYWKRFSLIEYKLNGTDASINVLAKSVGAFPNSVELWVEYLSALITQLGSEKVQDNQSQVDFTRDQFEDAVKLNGFQFMAHPLWDKYIEFETSLSKDCKKEILSILLRVIKIPLYHYAHYYKKFSEMCQSLTLSDYYEMDVDFRALIDTYLNHQGKAQIEELSLAEEQHILDDFTYKVFTKTQTKVSEVWKYESELTILDFSLQNYQATKNELNVWIRYIDNELEIYRMMETNSKDLDSAFEYIRSIFERAIIPNCLNGKIWLKYVSFLNQSHLSDEIKFEKISEIYNRANFYFVPLNDLSTRYSYQLFLLKNNMIDSCMNFCLELLQTLGGFKNDEQYLKLEYCEALESTLNIIYQLSPTELFLKKLEALAINNFSTTFNKHKVPTLEENLGQSTTENNQNKVALNMDAKKDFKENDGESEVLILKYFDSVQKVLRQEAVCVPVCIFLERSLIHQVSSSELRKFFNKYYMEPALQASGRFWKFYIEYEGLILQDMHNLLAISKHIKENTTLSKLVIDSFIDLSYDIINANLSQIIERNSYSARPETTLIYIDNDKSESLLLNQSARRRMAENNYIIQDNEDGKQQKTLGRSNRGKLTSYKEDELLKLTRKHLDHPSILRDQVPEITNSFMKQDLWIDMLDEQLQVPALPTFRNVEKANTTF